MIQNEYAPMRMSWFGTAHHDIRGGHDEGVLSVTKRIRPDANVALRQAQGDILLMMWDRYYFLNLAIMFLIFFT